MVDTTSTTERIDWLPIITIRSLHAGIMVYRYDCEKQRQYRENMIANRGLPKVRTDYGSEAK